MTPLPPRRRAWTAAVALAALAAALPAPASALPEGEAARHPLLEAAWHEPEPVLAGTQWQGRLRLAEGVPAERVQYQVCRVGEACFAPPQDAAALDGRTYGFDTATMAGGPVDFRGGWRVGVKWYIHDGGNVTVVPAGVDLSDPACLAEPLPCAETHYFAFDIAAGRPGDRGSPATGLTAVAAALAAAVPLRRKGGAA